MKRTPFSIILCAVFAIIYDLLVTLHVYFAVFVFLANWKLSTGSWVVIIIELAGAAALVTGAIGAVIGSTWARMTILAAASFNMAYWLYQIYGLTVDAMDYISYDGSFGPDFYLSYTAGSILVALNVAAAVSCLRTKWTT